ncbi:ABC transporter permease [Nonomuraea roseoviolacea subsp. roseoviolacea]
MTLSFRNPTTLLVSALQPLLYLFLFGPLLTGVTSLTADGRRTAYDIYVPALVLQLALFGGAFTGLTLLTEFRQGVLERMMATPIPRSALLAGRILRDTSLLVAQSVILICCSLVLGVRFAIGDVLTVLGMVALVAVTLSALSYYVALRTYNENSLSTVFNVALLPVLLLSGTMLPMTLAPEWLFWLSRADPLSYVVDGARAAFVGGHGWEVATAFGVVGTLACLTFLLAVRALSRRA